MPSGVGLFAVEHSGRTHARGLSRRETRETLETLLLPAVSGATGISHEIQREAA